MRPLSLKQNNFLSFIKNFILTQGESPTYDEIMSGLGFSSLGTLLTALTATVKGNGMLLPVLIFPLMLPGLLCVVKITDSLFFGINQEEVLSWWKFLISFDLILLTISILGFEIVLEE